MKLRSLNKQNIFFKMHPLDLKLGDRKEEETVLPDVLDNFLCLDDQDEIRILIEQQEITTVAGLILMVLTSNWGMELRIEIGGHLMQFPMEKCIQLWHLVMFYLDQSQNEWDLHFVAWDYYGHEDFILFQNCPVSPSDSFPPDEITEFPLLSALAKELIEEGNIIVAEPTPMSSETTTTIVETHRQHGEQGRVYQPVVNEPVPVQKTTSSLDLYPLETTDLDSSDLFLDYRHGPDKIEEVEQSSKPLFISEFENLELIFEDTERDWYFPSFYSYFPGNFGHVILPWKWGVIVHFIPQK